MTAIAINGLSHAYADGRTALSGITLSIEAGESVALVGPNGAGKTTLFLRLCGVLAGPAGQATVAGLDPAIAKDRKQLPRHVGIVFQQSDDQLFSPTVGEDVAFGPLNLGLVDVDERVKEALAIVGLNGFEGRSPHKLSGGEKRRAAIATVLAMRPGAILFDEPTQDLDPRGRKELMATLKGLPGTKLIASHDLDFVLDVCPRTVLLDAGRVLADGPTHTILSDDALLGEHGFDVPYRLRKS